MIDLHCHILPGLDDGAASLEVSLEMCRIACEDGIHTLVATPHMLNGMFEVTPEKIYEEIRRLSSTLEQERLPLQILPGADVHVRQELPEILARGEILTVAGKGKHLMVEFPQDVVPREMKELLFQVQLKGVTPIITHPERNVEIQQNPSLLSELIGAGNLTQVTAGSLTGSFGSRTHACALKLLHRNMVHLVASDAHNTGRRAPRLSEARAVVEKEKGAEEAKLLFEERARRILDGAYVEPPDPVVEKKKKKDGFWKRLLSYH